MSSYGTTSGSPILLTRNGAVISTLTLTPSLALTPLHTLGLHPTPSLLQRLPADSRARIIQWPLDDLSLTSLSLDRFDLKKLSFALSDLSDTTGNSAVSWLSLLDSSALLRRMKICRHQAPPRRVSLPRSWQTWSMPPSSPLTDERIPSSRAASGKKPSACASRSCKGTASWTSASPPFENSETLNEGDRCLRWLQGTGD